MIEIISNEKLSDDDFIICRTRDDFPTQTYDENHHIYLCVTQYGKVVVCRYVGGARLWENLANWRDNLGPIIAYKRITLPKYVINFCTTDHSRTVNYIDGLQKETTHA